MASREMTQSQLTVLALLLLYSVVSSDVLALPLAGSEHGASTTPSSLAEMAELRLAAELHSAPVPSPSPSSPSPLPPRPAAAGVAKAHNTRAPQRHYHTPCRCARATPTALLRCNRWRVS
eukprot:scpid58409/ scgid16691/ 